MSSQNAQGKTGKEEAQRCMLGLGQRPVGMSDEEYCAYLRRNGQLLPWRIRRFLPREPVKLTPEEVKFAQGLSESIDAKAKAKAE